MKNNLVKKLTAATIATGLLAASLTGCGSSASTSDVVGADYEDTLVLEGGKKS